MSNAEYIGKVKIDKSYYSGTNSGNTKIESMLDAVKSNSDYSTLIIEKKEWPYLYHLASGRENLLNWYPFDESSRVLEIGAECGALTSLFVRYASSVTSIEPSEELSLINAERNKDADNLEIKIGDVKAILDSLTESYDVITLISGNTFYPIDEYLPMLRNLLEPSGKIIVAVYNRLGFKALAEFADESDDCNDVHTYSKKELESIFKKYGFDNSSFYYPYPDHILPSVIYSDSLLPHKGELTDNDRNLDNRNYKLFEESAVYDDLIEAGVFPVFSNSYLVILGDNQVERVIYAKISDNRHSRYRIITNIVETAIGLVVRKTCLKPEGRTHIENVKKNEDKLSNIFNGRAEACKSSLKNDTIEFEYIEGIRFSSKLDSVCDSGDVDKITEVLDEYYDLIKCMKTSETFEPDNDFVNVFGEVNLPETLPSGDCVDIDLIPDNVVIRNGRYVILDYEWVFDISIPLEYVFWKGLFSSVAFSRLCSDKKEAVYSHYGLDAEKRALYLRMEESFQRYVSGGELTLRDFVKEMGRNTETVRQIIDNLNAVKVSNDNLKYELDLIKNSKSWNMLKKMGIVK